MAPEAHLDTVVRAMLRHGQARSGTGILPRTLLAGLLTVSGACKEVVDNAFSDTSKITARACAGILDDAGGVNDSDTSERIELTADGEQPDFSIRSDDGVICVVQPYTLFDPATGTSFLRRAIKDNLDHEIIGIAHPQGLSFREASEQEWIIKADLMEDCRNFAIQSEAPMCAAVCPEWDGPTALVVTDACTEIVKIDGDRTDELPAIPADDENTEGD